MLDYGIVNCSDRPCARLVTLRHGGMLTYLRHGRTIYEQVGAFTPLRDFGVTLRMDPDGKSYCVWLDSDATFGARYPDGTPRPWQGDGYRLPSEVVEVPSDVAALIAALDGRPRTRPEGPWQVGDRVEFATCSSLSKDGRGVVVGVLPAGGPCGDAMLTVRMDLGGLCDATSSNWRPLGDE